MESDGSSSVDSEVVDMQISILKLGQPTACENSGIGSMLRKLTRLNTPNRATNLLKVGNMA